MCTLIYSLGVFSGANMERLAFILYKEKQKSMKSTNNIPIIYPLVVGHIETPPNTIFNFLIQN